MARAMVTRYGMTERLGHVALERDRRSYLTPNELMAGPQQRDFSDETAAAVDVEVRQIVDKMFQRAVDILEQRRPVLDALARRLLEKETLDEAELRQGLTAEAATTRVTGFV